MNIQPSVSVVIPTRNRPHLLPRAIESVLQQTLEALEVIIVIDGPDPATVAVLQQIEDPRLKVIALPQSVRAAQARNKGIQEASAPWIAFLDDDDEWFSEKLERQLEVAIASPYVYPIVASRFVAKTPKGEFTWPRRLPNDDEALSEYLFTRNSWFDGEGQILTSTILAPRDLLIQVPFVHNNHEELDWLLKVSLMLGVGVEFVPEPMAVWHFNTGAGKQRLSYTNHWKGSLEWIRSVRSLVTRRAYSSFVMLNVSPPAAAAQQWQFFFLLLWEAIRFGQPRPFDFLLFMAMWLLPQDLRHRIRSALAGKRKETLQAST